MAERDAAAMYPFAMAGRRPARDGELVQIVDGALADATVRSGAWLACRPGCTPCCHGVFAMNTLDALRLQDGLAALAETDRERAERIRERARASVSKLWADFPGDPVSGLLGESERDQARFEEFANDEPCPVLDPATGACDLYSARPLTCRIFGPPVLSAEGLGMCELCFQGASETEIAAGEMHLTHGPLEDTLNEQAEKIAEVRGLTIVAFALDRQTEL